MISHSTLQNCSKLVLSMQRREQECTDLLTAAWIAHSENAGWQPAAKLPTDVPFVQTYSDMKHGQKTGQAARKPHATPNKKGPWAPSVWQQELTSSSTGATAQFQCETTILLFMSVCAEEKGEKDLRCVPSGCTCDNLCVSCLETGQTCSTVSHSTSPTERGLGPPLYFAGRY